MEVLSLAAGSSHDTTSSACARLACHAAAALPPAAAARPMAAAGVEGGASAYEASSLASSSTDLVAQQQQQSSQQQQQHSSGPLCPDSQDASQRTHHLLKHCLSQSQRGAALQQFNTSDPREAAKEIARMGQRELQAKFKEVYGSATKSNNNSWLRRKLYEAVGVAPLKANTKGKARKAGSSAPRKPTSKEGAGKARSPKVAPIKTKVQQHHATHYDLPPSPRAGMGTSILDLHQYSGLVSHESTSDSEDGGSGSHGTFPSSRHNHGAPDSPHSPLGMHFSGSSVFHMPTATTTSLGQQPHSRSVRQRVAHASFGPAGAPGFVPVAEPTSPLACIGAHWADGFPAAAAAAPLQRQASEAAAAAPAAPFLTAASQALGPLDADLACSDIPSAFKPMDLEQDASPLWDGSEPQPWYFGGGGMDLCLSLRATDGLPMDCGDSQAVTAAGVGVGCEDDDPIPLLTLDLGAIDVSI